MRKCNMHDENDLPKLKVSSVEDKSGRNIPDMSIDKSWLCSLINIAHCKIITTVLYIFKD
jgi:hypothetical protein